MELKFLTKEEYNQYRKENKQHRISFHYERGFTKSTRITMIDSHYMINGNMYRLAKAGYVAGPNFVNRQRYTLTKVF